MSDLAILDAILDGEIVVDDRAHLTGTIIEQRTCTCGNGTELGHTLIRSRRTVGRLESVRVGCEEILAMRARIEKLRPYR